MPAQYTFTARKNKKQPRTVTMTLAKRNATAVSHNPPRNHSKTRIPITSAHKTGILDPMSAIVALSMPAKGSDPCRQSVRIFDGKHRFDVRLTPKTTRRVEIREGKGFLRRARVCRVGYKPIAGHKPGNQSNYIASPENMEVWMVRSSNGLMYVPYRIVLPTILGEAVLQAQSIQIDWSNNRRIALVN